MSTPTIDYDALAAQHGGTAVVDYDALAAQHGGVAQTNSPAPAQQEGFFSSLGHTLGLPTSIEEAKAVADEHSVLKHPVKVLLGPAADAASALFGGAKRSAGELMQSYQNARDGNAAGAAVHAIAAVPIVGSGLDKGADQYLAGNYSGELGTALGTAIQAAPVVESRLAPAGAVRPGRISRMLESPLGDTVAKPRGTVPAEAASPAELKAYADQNGIPLNAAQATEHNFPRNLQSAGERATVGGTAVKKQTQAAQAAVIDHAQQLMDQFSPNTPDLATAGEKIQSNISAALAREKQAAQVEYSQIDQNANGVMVDLTPLKQEAAALLKDSAFIRSNISSLDPKRASLVVKGITELPDKATFTQAQQLRSALLDEARHPDVVISQQGQGWIKKLSGSADQQMSQAASSNPNLLQQFRDANAHWEGIQEAFNNPRSPLYQALQETDPNKVPQKFTGKGQIGGSPYSAEVFDKYGIDKSPVKWALLGDIMKKDFGLYNGGKTLAGYSDPFLRSMFSPDELDSLYKTGAIARSVRVNTNPSGTAVVEGAMSDVQHPVKSMMPKAMAAKATISPAFNDWLMKNPRPPSSQTAAFSRWINARRAALIAGAAQGNNQD